MGGQLGQLQFLVILLSRKTNIDADALLRVFWLGCMSDNSGTHLQVTAAVVQEAALKSHQVQQADPTLNLVITRVWDGTLG